jgi:flagellar motor switch protein FliN/FliY
MSAGQTLTLAVLGDVEVSVAVALGSARCRVSEVLAFCEGTVVALAARADAPVDVLVNGVAVASGDIVELEDGTLAVEISAVHSSTENRIA